MECFIFRGDTPGEQCLDALNRASGPLTARAVAERTGLTLALARKSLKELVERDKADFKTRKTADGKPVVFYFPVFTDTKERK